MPTVLAIRILYVLFAGSVHKILPMRAQCETIAKPGMRLVPVCSFQIDRNLTSALLLAMNVRSGYQF